MAAAAERERESVCVRLRERERVRNDEEDLQTESRVPAVATLNHFYDPAAAHAHYFT